MKLHLGCGSNYLRGYCNLDPYESIIPDKKAFSYNLPFSQNSISEIFSQQLIEHLGYVQTIFSLYEWYRVLRNAGKLIIETVDLEKTNKLLTKNNTFPDRINLKTWLFGVELQGMTHKYCFDKQELLNLLKQIGFSNISFKYSQFRKTQPILKIEANKKQNWISDIVSDYLSLLVKEKVVNLEKIDETYLEFDNILTKITKILQNGKKILNIISEALKELCVINPKYAIKFFELLKDNPKFKEYYVYILRAIQFCEDLAKNNISAYLAHSFYKFPKETGQHEIIYDIIAQKAKDYIDFKFNSIEKIKALSLKLFLWNNNKKISAQFYKFNEFTLSCLAKKSKSLVAQGIKYFALGKLQMAEKSFKEGLKFNAKNLFAYWNLARLYLNKADLCLAIIYYQKSFRVVSPFYKKELQCEISSIIRSKKENKYKEPKPYVQY